MKLSVIIPTYNRCELLCRAIDSVVAQVMPPQLSALQIIVIDDGSSDDTAQILKERYPEVEYLYQDNQGVSAARNAGIHKATGQWIALLDSDDQWLPNKLGLQFDLLEKEPLLICHTEEIWIRNGVRVNQMNKHKKVGGWIFEQCLPLCAMSPSSIIIHKSVINDVGLFDVNLHACEDYDLWLRISAHYKVAFVEQPCINKYGGHEDQLSRQYWGMDRFRVQALEKVLSQKLAEPLYLAAKEMLISKLTILLNGAIKRGNNQLMNYCDAKLAYWQSRNDSE